MFWLAAAIVASTPSQAPHSAAGASAHAQATIRIVAGVRLRLREPSNVDAPSPRETVVRADGGVRPASLIEFE